jgi:hypothetical protein
VRGGAARRDKYLGDEMNLDVQVPVAQQQYIKKHSRPGFQLLLALLLFTAAGTAFSQGTSFTYQGRVTDNGSVASGSYDMQFSLYDTAAIGTGTLQGSPGTVTIPGVAVTNGIFTVQLNFGSTAFPGAARYLEIALKHPADASYTTMSPRSQVTSTPYAVRALQSTLADNATQLNGQDSSQYVLTGDSRLSDARTPTAGSANYVQNTTSTQAASNFNISGNGTAGGTLSANVVNSATQYNIGGSGVLSVLGNSNTFVGLNAGAANTPSGGNGTFVGNGAGQANTSGFRNSFFGTGAGRFNTTGNNNAFFGTLAGASNSTASSNSFFGDSAGFLNTTGFANSFFGYNSGVSNTTSTGNSFFGYFSGNANTACCNSFFGTSAGVSNSIGTGNSFFGYIVGASNTTGSNNSFFGSAAGNANTANDNSFFGFQAGTKNAAGTANSFFGSLAGTANTSGSFNAFFGYNAGAANTTAINNSFFGQGAGFKNTTGSDNTFLGNGAGLNNATTGGNTFVGSLAGKGNVGGANNTFLGVNAGQANVGSSNNTFVGANAANTNLTGSGNTYIGANTDGATIITNSTAIGQNAYAGQSNSIILGSVSGVNGSTADTFVGMGVTTPSAKLHIRDSNASNTTVLVESSFSGGAGIELSNTATGGGRWLMMSGGNLGSIGTLHFVDQKTGGEVLGIGGAGPNINGNGVVSLHGDLYAEGLVSVGILYSGGSTSVCRNAVGYLSACSSSLRYKKDLQPFTSGLSLINRLKPITFRWKSDNSLDLGFGAEDVAAVEPLLVTHNAQGQVEGVKYDRISAALVNAVKEQQTQIEKQQAQIEEQKARIEQQQSLIEGLKVAVCQQNTQLAICSRPQ